MADTVKRFMGRNARLYYSTTWNTPTWANISKRDTLALVLGSNRENVTAEDSAGWDWEQEVTQTVGLSFSAFFSTNGLGDSFYSAVETARAAGSPLTFAICDGPIESDGIKYRKLELYIGQVTDNRDVKGVGKIDVECYLGPTANAPTTMTVSSET